MNDKRQYRQILLLGVGLTILLCFTLSVPVRHLLELEEEMGFQTIWPSRNMHLLSALVAAGSAIGLYCLTRIRLDERRARICIATMIIICLSILAFCLKYFLFTDKPGLHGTVM